MGASQSILADTATLLSGCLISILLPASPLDGHQSRRVAGQEQSQITLSANFSEMFPEQEHPGDCGLNALYTVLLLNDILPDYDQLREVVSPQPNTGNTLVELRDAARVYELELDLVWVTPQELQFYDLPLIIHCEKWIDEGHYRVVVSFTDDNRVRVMETRNGLVHEVNLSKVDFSGFALVPHARCVHEWRSWTLFAFCGALGVFLSIRALTHGLTARQIPRRPSGRFGKIVVFALIMSLVLCLLITMTRHGISNVALRELPRFSEVASHQDPRPIEVQPLGRPLGGFAADEMNRLLALTTPYWSYRRASDMLHCLRLWGPKCAFLGLPSFPSEQLTAMTGGEMVHALTESSATHFRPTRYGLETIRKRYLHRKFVFELRIGFDWFHSPQHKLDGA